MSEQTRENILQRIYGLAKESASQMQECIETTKNYKTDVKKLESIERQQKKQLTHKRNQRMHQLYADMHDPEKAGTIHLNYPNGLAQFFKDIENGMYDD